MGPIDYLSVFLLGLAGTGHCIGMCGAFAIAAGAGPGGAPRLVLRQVSYQLGKATSYVFIGVLLTLGAGSFAGVDGVSALGNVLGWIVGGFMAAMGVLQLGGFSLGLRAERWLGGGGACATIFAAAKAPTMPRSLLIGWINGFLPCGLSIAALLYLARFGSVLDTTLGAYVFGFGTMPGLLATAALGQRMSVSFRTAWVRISGVALVILGIVTVVRGVPEFHEWIHGILVPGGHSGMEHQGHSFTLPDQRVG